MSAQYSPPPSSTSSPSRGRGLVISGAIAMGLGVVLGIVLVVVGFASLFDADPQAVGEVTTLTAEAGEEFSLYASTPFDRAEGCRVRDVDGQPITLSTPFGQERLELNGRPFYVVGTFRASQAGVLEVSCPFGDYSVGPRVAILATVGTVLLGFFGGGGLFVVGLVLLVIGLSQRSKARKAAQGPFPGQPGPYGGQPGPYGSQPGPYGGQPGPYGGQPGPYGGQPGPYESPPYQ